MKGTGQYRKDGRGDGLRAIIAGEGAAHSNRAPMSVAPHLFRLAPFILAGFVLSMTSAA
jgi:hypothetical protein